MSKYINNFYNLDTNSRTNIIGIFWMILAMLFFAIEDALFKEVASSIGSGQAIILFGLGGSFIFMLAMLWRKEPILIGIRFPIMRTRMVFEVVGRMFYFLSIALTPLSSTTAILQATPLVVVLGSVLFFGEKVSLFKWIAILIGLVGVLIILQPVSDAFSLLSVLPVIGLIGFAGRDLASRAAPSILSSYALGFYGFIAIFIAGVIVSLWNGNLITIPSVFSIFILVSAVFCGVIAYVALMKAMRTGEVSSVTPFRYTRLLFGVLLGYFVFGETVSQYFWIGAFVIVASGLFILLENKN